MYFTAMRPTFQMKLPFTVDEVMSRLVVEFQKPERDIRSLLFKQYVELHIPKPQIRCWSPHLSLSFEADGQATRVHGRFAPRMEVWTLIWIVYLVLAFSAFFAASFQCAFWMLGQATWCGWAGVLALVGMGCLYVLSQVGQAWSADQMLALKSDWESVVDRTFRADDTHHDASTSTSESEHYFTH